MKTFTELIEEWRKQDWENTKNNLILKNFEELNRELDKIERGDYFWQGFEKGVINVGCVGFMIASILLFIYGDYLTTVLTLINLLFCVIAKRKIS